MLEFVNEAVTVETQNRPNGLPRPMAFVWRGRRFQVTSWGREQAKTEDGPYCYLVQTAGAETWELCRDEDACWTLTRRWTRPKRII